MIFNLYLMYNNPMIKYYTQENLSYIYILVNDYFIKIGKADNLFRVSEMIYRYDFQLSESYIVEVDTSKSDIFKLEKLLHNQFQNYRFQPPIKMDGSSELFGNEVLDMLLETFEVTTKYINGVSDIKLIGLSYSDLMPRNKKILTLSESIDYTDDVAWIW